MFDIGFSELLLFGVIALIVLGPEKLPSAARTAGQWYAKLRRTVSSLQSEIEAELDLAETRKLMQDELAKIRENEAQMRREMNEMRGNMREFESAQNESIKAASTPQQTGAEQATPAEFDYAYASIKDASSFKASSRSASIDEFEDYTSDMDADVTDTIDSNASDTVNQQPTLTKPWENMWFVLGAYDKARRLPAPPYLPNYQADMLLNAHINTANHQAQNKASNQQEASL